MQFDSDADELAKLVCEWQSKHPQGLRGLLWYRLPVATDQRNWRWPTFAAVIEGRAPVRHLKASTSGVNPIDLSVINDGEASDNLGHIQIRVSWPSGILTASEALPGWKIEATDERSLVVTATSSTAPLPPGARRSIGWLRLDPPAIPHAEVIQ